MKVVTYNTWQLPFPVLGGKNRAARFKLLPAALAATHADVLLLQEVWHPRLQRELTQELGKLGYKHVFGRQRFYQDGLMIASRWPFESQVTFKSYSQPTKGLERLLKKGALRATVQVPNQGNVEFVCIHLPAAIGDQGRLDALDELFGWLDATGDRPMVVGGDYNFYPTQFDNKYWQHLTERWQFTPTLPADGLDDPQYYTWSPDNKYAAGTSVFGHIDQIWLRYCRTKSVSGQVLFKNRKEWAPTESEDPPELSDHLAWAVNLEF